MVSKDYLKNLLQSKISSEFTNYQKRHKELEHLLDANMWYVVLSTNLLHICARYGCNPFESLGFVMIIMPLVIYTFVKYGKWKMRKLRFRFDKVNHSLQEIRPVLEYNLVQPDCLNLVEVEIEKAVMPRRRESAFLNSEYFDHSVHILCLVAGYLFFKRMPGHFFPAMYCLGFSFFTAQAIVHMKKLIFF